MRNQKKMAPFLSAVVACLLLLAPFQQHSNGVVVVTAFTPSSSSSSSFDVSRSHNSQNPSCRIAAAAATTTVEEAAVVDTRPSPSRRRHRQGRSGSTRRRNPPYHDDDDPHRRPRRATFRIRTVRGPEQHQQQQPPLRGDDGNDKESARMPLRDVPAAPQSQRRSRRRQNNDNDNKKTMSRPRLPSDGKIRTISSSNNDDDDVIAVGREMYARVVRIVPYGAFCDIGLPGGRRHALLHVSRLHGLHRVRDVRDHVSVGQRLRVRVIRCDHRDDDGDVNVGVSLLSRENDAFVDRRQLQARRMRLCRQVAVQQRRPTDDDDDEQRATTEAQRELREIDRQLWELLSEFTPPRTLEV